MVWIMYGRRATLVPRIGTKSGWVGHDNQSRYESGSDPNRDIRSEKEIRSERRTDPGGILSKRGSDTREIRSKSGSNPRGILSKKRSDPRKEMIQEGYDPGQG